MPIQTLLRSLRPARRVAAGALTVLAFLGSVRPALADPIEEQQTQEETGRRTLMFWIGTWDFTGQGYAPGTRSAPARAATTRSAHPKAVRHGPAAARRRQPRVRREHRAAPRPAAKPKSADSHG
jgi:hypothetical protein